MPVNLDFIGRDRVTQLLDSVNRRLLGMEENLRDVSRQSNNLDQTLGNTARRIVAQWFGIDRAIQAAIDSVRVYDRNLREAAESTSDLLRETIAFSELQPAGVSAERRAQALALGPEFGIQQRRDLIDIVNTVQDLQSQRGGFAQGLAATRTVLAAGQLGIPVAAGREAEIFGASLGLQPGEALTQAFVAGRLSGRTPGVIARAIPSFTEFERADVAAAAGGTLAGFVMPTQLRTATARAGQALQAGEAIDRFLQARGIDATTQLERLRQLSLLEISTPEQLSVIVGLGEATERRAIGNLLRQMPVFENMLAQLQGVSPEMIMARRAELETTDPALATERQIGQVRAEMAVAQLSPAAMQRSLRRRRIAAAFRAQGIEQLGPFDIIDPEGDLAVNELLLPFLLGIFGPRPNLRDPLGRRVRDLMSGIGNAVRETEIATPPN